MVAACSTPLVPNSPKPPALAGKKGDQLRGSTCGAAAAKIEKATGVTLEPVSQEPDVKSTLSKVTTGNADAGLVYVSDARAAGSSAVRTVDVPEATDVVNTYPVAALADADEPELAAEWVALVTGDVGRDALADAGFGLP